MANIHRKTIESGYEATSLYGKENVLLILCFLSTLKGSDNKYLIAGKYEYSRKLDAEFGDDRKRPCLLLYYSDGTLCRLTDTRVCVTWIGINPLRRYWT